MMTARRSRSTEPPAKRKARAPRGPGEGTAGVIVPSLHELEVHHETGPRLTGGDVDADWTRAAAEGEEGVGGSAATPDQDVVDELGRALGVDQGADAEVRTAREILMDRDAHRWRLEREAADAADGRPLLRRKADR